MRAIDNATCQAVLRLKPLLFCEVPCSGLEEGSLRFAYCNSHGGLGRADAELMEAGAAHDPSTSVVPSQ